MAYLSLLSEIHICYKLKVKTWFSKFALKRNETYL